MWPQPKPFVLRNRFLVIAFLVVGYAELRKQKTKKRCRITSLSRVGMMIILGETQQIPFNETLARNPPQFHA